MNQPIHIVMTPTRNEAWVIRAFLESTTRWADYVIICDQFSTDGTREIVESYSQPLPQGNGDRKHRAEVILIDNPNTEFNEAEGGFCHPMTGFVYYRTINHNRAERKRIHKEQRNAIE